MTLRAATGIFAVGFALHHLDHLRRGYGVVDDDVILGRTVAAMLVAVMVTLVATRHRSAPRAAAAVGTLVIIGVVAVRLVPPVGQPSDHLGADGTEVWSWAAVIAELIAAAVLVFAAGRELRQSPAYQS